MAILFFEKENANVPANVSNFCKRFHRMKVKCKIRVIRVIRA